MEEVIGASIRLLNGFVTLYLAYTLYNDYQLSKKKFYQFWSIGFLFYGFNIVMRVFIPEPLEITLLGIIVFILAYAGFTAMLTGIGDLIYRSKSFLMLSFIFPTVLLLASFLGDATSTLVWVTALIPYLLIVLSLLGIQYMSGFDLKLLISGWALLLLINVTYLFGVLETAYVDLFSVFGKLIIFWGMTQPNFSYIEEDLRSFFLHGLPQEYSDEPLLGKVILVNLNSGKGEDIKWIKNRAAQNNRKGIRTVLLSYYDVITPGQVLDNGAANDLYVVRVLSGKNSEGKLFDHKVTTISDDVNRLEILFSEILKYSEDMREPCEIIIYSLSYPIITHGWRRIYSFLTSKNVQIKSSRIQLVAFYSPDAHEEKSDIAKFEYLADFLIKK